MRDSKAIRELSIWVLLAVIALIVAPMIWNFMRYFEFVDKKGEEWWLPLPLDLWWEFMTEGGGFRGVLYEILGYFAGLGLLIVHMVQVAARLAREEEDQAGRA